MEKKHLKKIFLKLLEENYLKNGFYNDDRQIGILTIKSLYPSSSQVGNIIDYDRYSKELRLWGYYRRGNKHYPSLSSTIDGKTYFENKDYSILFRIIPLVYANKSIDLIVDEIKRNVLYTSGNIESLLEAIGIGILLAGGRDQLKDRIISLSQKDLINEFESSYRFNINEYNKSYRIEFEKTRIELISLLNGVDVKGFEILDDILQVIDGNTFKTELGRIILKSLDDDLEINMEDKLVENMIAYMDNLRKSRIDPKKLKIEDYVLPNIFSYEEGDVFFHSLINYGKVIKKEVTGKNITSLITTKTGEYVFKRHPI